MLVNLKLFAFACHDEIVSYESTIRHTKIKFKVYVLYKEYQKHYDKVSHSMYSIKNILMLVNSVIHASEHTFNSKTNTIQ